MTERAVPSVPLAASNLTKTVDTVDDKGEKPDRYGEWLADDARIWRVYERLAKQDDDEKVKRWSGGLNNLAIFATLFSGITTAFIIESQGDLKPDFSELAYRVQNATAHGRLYVEEPFVVSGQARLVNCLWITSLILSLSAALISVMGQDWVEMYVDKPVCNARQWAEIRSFRLHGVYQWYMPGVIATAPVLLHASLFLFGIGLAVFMTSDAITRNLCIGLCAVVAFLYAVIMFSPVLWSSSPFRSPATMLVRRWFCVTFQRKGDKNTSLTENAAIRYVTRHVAAARRWIRSYFSLSWAADDLIRETYGSHVSNRCVAVFRQWSSRRGSNESGSLPRNHRETRPQVAESQNTAPWWLLNLPWRPQTIANPIHTRYGPDVPNRWTCFCLRFSATCNRYGGPALLWIQNGYTNFRTVFSRILDNSYPDFSNGWSDIRQKPSLALVADSLSWLSSASSSPEVAQLIVLGHCDHVTGLQVMKHPNSQSLIQKLHQYADDNWDHMSVLDLSRYVIVCANAGRRRNWPARVWQRVGEVRDTETPISQDFLLAYAHLTDGLRICGIEQVERLCARVPEHNTITLQTLALIIAQRSKSNPDEDDPWYLIVLMNKWRDALPSDLMQVDRAFQAMLPNEVVNQRNKLSSLCLHATVEREPEPVDSILHSLVAFFVHYRDVSPVRSTRDLVLSLALHSPGSHTCLAAMFGDSDPDITKAGWTGLPAHAIMSALQKALFFLSADDCEHDLQPMLARTIARCIWPPFPLLATSNISAQTALSHGSLLFRLVEDMSSSGALPDDLFLPVLEHGALAKLAAFLCESPRNADDFLYVLGAISLWIETRSGGEDRLALFELFIARPTTTGPDDAVWDFIDGLGTALASDTDSPLLVFATWAFMSAMGKLRAVFPKRTLWKDIARQYGANKHHFPAFEWRRMSRAVRDGTGFDPDKVASENSPPITGVAAQGDESAPSGSSAMIEPTTRNGGVGANSPAYPAPYIAWIAAGATPGGGI